MLRLWAPNYDLSATMQSGQVFSYTEMTPGTFEVISDKHRCRVSQEGDHLLLSVDGIEESEELANFWGNYFNIGQNIEQLATMASSNEFLTQVVNEGYGIHILNQDPWDCLVWAMISVRNNIPRIKATVQRLCRELGDEMPGGYWRMPTPGQLARADLTPFSLGFRKDNIHFAAEFVDSRWVRLYEMTADRVSYQRAFQELNRLPGVGEKVANCVCLFGLGHSRAFPVDIHIARMLQLPELQGFVPADYGEYAGLLQQYMFVYALKHGY